MSLITINISLQFSSLQSDADFFLLLYVSHEKTLTPQTFDFVLNKALFIRFSFAHAYHYASYKAPTVSAKQAFGPDKQRQIEGRRQYG